MLNVSRNMILMFFFKCRISKLYWHDLRPRKGRIPNETFRTNKWMDIELWNHVVFPHWGRHHNLMDVFFFSFFPTFRRKPAASQKFLWRFLWEESFDNFVDHKFSGPTARGFDVTFEDSMALVGLPEALKRMVWVGWNRWEWNDVTMYVQIYVFITYIYIYTHVFRYIAN